MRWMSELVESRRNASGIPSDSLLGKISNMAPEFHSVNPVIAPRPSAVGGMVKQEQVGGRDVAPIGAGLQVPRALPVGLHKRLSRL